MLQLHSTSSASIDLVGSAWVHFDNSAFPDIECALSEAVVTEEEEEEDNNWTAVVTPEVCRRGTMLGLYMQLLVLVG